MKRVIKSRRMRWAGHVTREGKKRNTYTQNFSGTILKKEATWKTGLDGRTRVKWVLQMR
jgi:hypothetical protein